MKNLFLIIFAITLQASFLVASPYDHCGQILANGIYDTYMTTKDSYEETLLKNWACSSDSSSETNIFSLNLIVSGIGGGVAYENSQAWKQDNCASDETQYKTGDYSHNLIQEVNPGIVEAWKECVSEKNKGLICYAEESDSSISFKIDWNPPPGMPRNLNAQIGLRNLNSLIELPTNLLPGEDTLDLVIDDPGQEAKVILRASNGETFRTSCSYLLLPPPEAAGPPTDPGKPDDIVKGPYTETFVREYVIGNLYIQVHEKHSGLSNAPWVEVTVPENFKILSGGARTNWSQPGNLLTSSYPVNDRTWFVSAAEHGIASKATITAYAVAARMIDGSPIPNNVYQIESFQSGKSSLAKGLVSLPREYQIIGGGARVLNTVPKHRNLLFASYPYGERSWVAASKDHQYENPASIIAYVIGFDVNFLAYQAKVDAFIKNETSIYEEEAPAGLCTVERGAVLIGGGARANWKRKGIFLTASYPQSYSTWVTKAKSHNAPENSNVTTWCIGLKSL
ncbi:hypothetical protein JYT19_00070 [Sulfobacillus acidophilus]|uniref:Uncharacterized protein n=1 Tax=Sulfobacillus acidophilus TaxID=53633 RepID=A0ABS3AW56_9FIRM|nr:hypothetical protein [Sulfobacillus acidophilus]